MWYCEKDRLNVGVGGWAKGRPLTKRCQDPDTDRLRMCGHNLWSCEREGQSSKERHYLWSGICHFSR